MSEVSFTVSARTALLIGQENFANADGAIIELVKNSYDADANKVLVVFDNAHEDSTKHKLHIIDNGEGMTQEVVVEKWMKIGTSNKQIDFRSKKGRIKTGAKGIGRFALDRLGKETSMLTKAREESQLIEWKMNWKQFEEPNKTISQIKATINSFEHSTLHEEIKNQLLLGTGQKLLDAGAENESPVPALEKILKKEFRSGTIITISGLKDAWGDRELNKIFKGLEALIPPADLEVFSVYLYSTREPEEYGQISTAYFNDFDYKIEAFFDTQKLRLNLKMTRDEFDFKKIEKEHRDIFEGKEQPYNLETMKAKSFEYSKDIQEVLKWNSKGSDELLREVGDFRFIFYYLKRGPDRDGDRYPLREPSYGERRKSLDRFGGVKIYRDSFRVRPYGEPGDDWLDLGKREGASPAGAGQTIGAWRVKSSQLAGTISISRITNPKLKDKSDRGSLIENETFETFKKVIIGILHEFEQDRSKIYNPFYLKWDKRRKEEEEARIRAKAEELAKEIVAEQERKKKTIASSSATQEAKQEESLKQKLASTFREFASNENEETQSEEATLRGLASLGIIISSSSHELRGLRNNILRDLKDLKTAITSEIATDRLKAIPFDDNPIKILEGIKEDQLKVKYWLNYAITGINRDKRKRTNLNLEDYFSRFKTTWEDALGLKNIELILSPPKRDKPVIRAFEIDMDTIFNNLVANSIDAFIEQSDIVDRQINLLWRIEDEMIVIDYSDNGPGLPEVFVNPEEIFLPFVSSKKDELGNQAGTGLGMYLVKLVLSNYNGEIDVIESESGFATSIKLPIRKG